MSGLQSGGAVARRHGRFVGAEDVSAAAHTEAGTIHAGAALPARRDAAHDGQRRHVLRPAHPLHLHLQVSGGDICLPHLGRNDVANVCTSPYLCLNPSFSANPPYRSLSFVSFKIHYMDFADCLLLLLSISVFLLFSFFSVFTLFSCRFRAVD